MLIAIGLLFLYTDIYIGSIDFLPDILGYIFLFISIFRGWQYRKWYPSKILVGCIVVTMLSMMAGGDRTWYWLTLLLEGFVVIGQWLLIRSIYMLHRGETYDRQQDTMIKTALLLIVCCQLCRPILSLVPVFPYILDGIQAVIGILVTVWIYRCMKHSALPNN